MKAKAFAYHKPLTVAAAVEMLQNDEAMPLAGGQSLMPMMNFRIAAPEALIDLNAIEGLAGITVAEGWLNIGAMTRYTALEASEDVATHAPLLARALPHIAHPAIRNRGTIGGSCALADPAAEMPALLLALGGELTLQGGSGTRRIAADGFFLGLFETARDEDELITAVHLPLAASGQRFGFHEITRRHGDYAMAGCAISAGQVTRVALFGVADRALRVPGAEAALPGDVEAAVAALAEVSFEGDVHADASTKQHLAGVALRRAWAEATA